MGYVDMHCHMMPGVDDGSQNVAMSYRMIEIAHEEGIDTCILTPHYKPGHRHVAPGEIGRFAKEMTARSAVQGMPVKFYAGNELMYFSEACDRLDEGIVCTLAGSDYVLVEFEPLDDEDRILAGLRQLIYAGYRPVLAHIERYECMMKSKNAWRLVADMGCLIQANTGSITGDFGHMAKVYTRMLLKEQALHFVSTDAHRDYGRAPYMKASLSYEQAKHQILNHGCRWNAHRWQDLYVPIRRGFQSFRH